MMVSKPFQWAFVAWLVPAYFVGANPMPSVEQGAPLFRHLASLLYSASPYIIGYIVYQWKKKRDAERN